MNSANARPRIVVGVDGSDASIATVTWAAREARLRGTELWILHAWTSGDECAAPYATPRPTLHEQRDRAAKVLGRCVAEAVATDPNLPIRARLEYGPPAKMLLTHTLQAELLVLGGRQAASRFDHVPGAVVRACLRSSSCPVVVTTPGRPHAVHVDDALTAKGRISV